MQTKVRKQATNPVYLNPNVAGNVILIVHKILLNLIKPLPPFQASLIGFVFGFVLLKLQMPFYNFLTSS